MYNLDQLKNIKRLEAPDFLYSRIQARILSAQVNRLPLKYALAMIIAVFALFALDAAVVRRSSQANHGGFNESSYLMPQNQLYYE